MPIKDAKKRAEYNREYQKKNRERIYKKHREWIEKNKEKQRKYHRDYNQEWYKKNKEIHDAQGKVWDQNPENKKKRVLYVQKYTQKNKDKVYSYGHSYNRTIAGFYRLYKSRAKKTEKCFELTPQEFSTIVSSPCVYCGETEKRIGVDRIKNEIGYTKENSTPCCKMCNYMKNKHSVTDFLSHITKIYEHNVKKETN